MSVSRNSAKAVNRKGTTAETVQSWVRGGRRARKACLWHDRAANATAGSCCSRRKRAVTQRRTASCRHQQSRRVSRSEMTPRSTAGNWTNVLGKVAWRCAVNWVTWTGWSLAITVMIMVYINSSFSVFFFLFSVFFFFLLLLLIIIIIITAPFQTNLQTSPLRPAATSAVASHVVVGNQLVKPSVNVQSSSRSLSFRHGTRTVTLTIFD